MDLSKKRKTDENGTAIDDGGDTAPPSNLTPEDALKIIKPFTQTQLLEIVQNALIRHPDVLDAVRTIADHDPAQRKLFVRGLGLETTTDRLRAVFSEFGELEEAIVIVDKSTGKSKGYGFVTFKHIDGALLALKEPSKKIDERMTVTQLASAGTASNSTASDVSNRKIYVGNVPMELPARRLLEHFEMYGEIEEGPLGLDKTTGKPKGFAFFVYKTEEGARESVIEPTKNIDGHQVICKFAVDNKKVKAGAVAGQAPSGVPGDGLGDRYGIPPPSSMPGSQYGPPGGLSYGGYSVGQNGPPAMSHLNHNMNSSYSSSIGGPAPAPMSGSGGYASGFGGTYGGSSQYGAPGSGEYGLNSSGASMYRLPQSSAAMPSGGYPDSGPYGSSTFPNQHQQQSSSVPRVPPGGMYPNMPSYY